jgi:signal transduction histidine kinase
MPKTVDHIMTKWKHTCLILALLAGGGCVSDYSDKTKQYESTTLEIDSLNQLAYEYLETNLDSSMTLSIKVEQISTSIDYPQGAARAISLQGTVLNERGQYDSAIRRHRKALDIRKSNNDVIGIGKSYNNIAEVYKESRDYYSALEFADSAFNIYAGLSDYAHMAGAASNKAINHARLKSYDSARIWFYRSLKLAVRSKESKRLQGAYYNYGNFLRSQGQRDSGVLLLNKALGIAIKDSMYADIPRLYLSIGQSIRKKDPVRALVLYDTALKLAREQELDRLEEKILKSKVNLLEDSQDLEAIIPVYEEFIEVIKSNYDKKRVQDFADFEVKYETAEKEADNIRLNEVHERDKLAKKWLVFSLILVSIVFVLMYRSQVQKRKLAIQEHARKIDSLLKQEESKNIDAMIEFQESERTRIASDLHDRLGSILSAVKLNFASMKEQLQRMDSEHKDQLNVVTALIDDAATEVRRISHDMASSVLANFGLLHAVYDLKNALETSGKIKIEVYEHGMDKRLSSAQEVNIYRIIQELVSNSLKHAKATQIDIHFTKEEEMFTVIVEDNGVGFPKDRKPTSGIGLKNIEKRISDLNGSFTIDSNPKSGTTAIIELKT